MLHGQAHGDVLSLWYRRVEMSLNPGDVLKDKEPQLAAYVDWTLSWPPQPQPSPVSRGCTEMSPTHVHAQGLSLDSLSPS